MKKCRRTLTVIILSLFLFTGWSMPSFWRKRKADKLYKNEEYPKALDIYQDLQIDFPFKADINYNNGNILYRLGKYDEAENAFKKALQSKDKNILKKAHYNIGNTLYRQDKLEEAVKSYEETLKIDSTDQDAVYNIELIKKKLQKKEQQKEQQPDKDKQDKKDKEQDKQKTGGGQKKEDQKDKSSKDSKEINGQKKEDKPENKPEQENDNKRDKSAADKQEKNDAVEKAKREQAKQILDALKHDEKKIKQDLNEKDEFNDQEEKVKYDW